MGRVTRPIFHSRTFPIRRALHGGFWWFALLLLATEALPQGASPEFPNPGNAHMSREKQRALGLQAAAQVYKQMPVLPDSSPETKYIRQLGEKLVSTIPPEYSWPFEFHVVAQKDINAFALPGGPMFVNIGTITAAANEAQLAGVMAHEMSHVYMQHSAKQEHKAQTASIFEGLAGAALGATMGGAVGELGEMGIQMTAQGVMLKYSRGDESQADAVGAIILYKAGYNPQALADFFETLEKEGGQAPPQWLSDHPNPGNRREAIEKEIRSWPPENYAGDSAAFQNVRQHATGVKAYTGQEIAQRAKSGEWAALNQKNGATFTPSDASALTSTSASAPRSPREAPAVSLESVLPGQRMVKEDFGAVKIERPENWQVTMPKRQGQVITIAPAAGIAPDGGVGYGVVVNGVAPPNGDRLTIDDVTNALVEDMRQNSGLEPLGSAQPIKAGGTEGRSVTFESASPFLTANGQAQKERDWLVTVPVRGHSVIYMVFVAPQSDFARLKPTFEAMLNSLEF